MSHFYGSIQGHRGAATRCGAKNSGYTAVAAGWQGSIHTTLWYDESSQVDRYRVTLEGWSGSQGRTQILAEGILDVTKQLPLSNILGQFQRISEILCP